MSWRELQEPDQDGRREVQCDQCRLSLFSAFPLEKIHHNCTGWREPGVGDHLGDVFHSIGLRGKPKCGCAALRRGMNALGPAGCRTKRDELAAQLREKAAEYGWSESFAAGFRAAKAGLALRINWLDPFPSLIDLAIERTEAAAREQPPDCAAGAAS